MSGPMSKLIATAVFATTISSFARVTSAMPVSDALAIRNSVPVQVESVQWRRGLRGWGWRGAGAGFVAGAVIGGAIAAPYYGYGYRPYYPAPNYYAAPSPVYYGAPGPVYYGATGWYGYGPVWGVTGRGWWGRGW
jgi:hypothetical protein